MTTHKPVRVRKARRAAPCPACCRLVLVGELIASVRGGPFMCASHVTRKQAGNIPVELGTGYPEPHGVMPAYGLFARHVRDLELANVSVSFARDDFRPAIECADVDGLEMDNFKAQLAKGVPAAKFEKVSGLVIINSPALKKHWWQ